MTAMIWYLETARLRLRALNLNDAQLLLDLNSDPRVMRYLGPEFDTLEGAAEVLPKIIARNERFANQLGLFAAFEKTSDEVIGWFILRPDRETPDDTTNLEIGYRLKHAHWGKGYGTEASLGLVELARMRFSVRRIYAEAMPGNRASIRIMEKVGLTFEKKIPEAFPNGQVVDLVVYSRKF